MWAQRAARQVQAQARSLAHQPHCAGLRALPPRSPLSSLATAAAAQTQAQQRVRPAQQAQLQAEAEARRAKRIYVPKHERQALAAREAQARAEAAQLAQEAALHPVQYLSFFLYVSIPPASLPDLRASLWSSLASLGARGRIYLSSEGINAQMVCPLARMPALRHMVDHMAEGRFKGVEFTLGEVQVEREMPEELTEGARKRQGHERAKATAALALAPARHNAAATSSPSAASTVAASSHSSLAHETAAAPAAAASPAASTPVAVSPFNELRVRIRPRLVQDGLSPSVHSQLRLADHGESLSPQDWHAELSRLLKEPSKVHPASVVLDCRNFYESDVGRFEGAIPTDTQTYPQTFEKVEELLAAATQKAAAVQGQTSDAHATAGADSSATAAAAVASASEPQPTAYLYCTGGIRCIKVGAYLRARGVGHQIKLLKGGINAYANFVKQQEQQQQQQGAPDSALPAVGAPDAASTVPAPAAATPAVSAAPFSSVFKGKNFQFDARTEAGVDSLGVRVTGDVLANCAHCGTPWDTHVNCRNARCHALFLQCKSCAKEMDHTCSAECREVVQAVLTPAASASSSSSSSSSSAAAAAAAAAAAPFAGLPRKEGYEFRPRITWATTQEKRRMQQQQQQQQQHPSIHQHQERAFHSWSTSAPHRSFYTAARRLVAVPPPAAATPVPFPPLPPAYVASYCAAHSSPPASAPLLDLIHSRTSSSMPERANMLSDALVGSVVRALVTAATAGCTPDAPPRLLELGAFTGYSTAWLLDCLPPAPGTGVGEGSAAKGIVVSCELQEEYAALVRENLASHPRFSQLQLRVAPALESLQALASEQPLSPFDFIYLDANKKANGAYVDLILRAGLLKHPSGVLLVDNTLWKGGAIGVESGAPGGKVDSMAKAVHAFNKAMLRDERLMVTMLPIRDGITVVQFRPSWQQQESAATSAQQTSA